MRTESAWRLQVNDTTLDWPNGPTRAKVSAPAKSGQTAGAMWCENNLRVTANGDWSAACNVSDTSARF